MTLYMLYTYMFVYICTHILKYMYMYITYTGMYMQHVCM